MHDHDHCHGRGVEVKGGADVWDPHVSKWKERSSRGILVYMKDEYS